jgi:hypothetical protein
MRREDERLTSLLGRSRSFMEERDGVWEPSSRDEDDGGLSPRCRDRLDILLSHVWPVVCSFPSVDESLSEVQGLKLPDLLMELSRESVPILCVPAEGVTRRRKIEVDSRRSIRSDRPGIGITIEVGG